MNIETANNLLVNGSTKIKQPEKSIGEFRCFNYNKISILGPIQVGITSKSSTTKNYTILLLDINTINMGRDVKDKLDLRLTMSPQKNKVRINYSIYPIYNKKHPNGYSKNIHISVRD